MEPALIPWAFGCGVGGVVIVLFEVARAWMRQAAAPKPVPLLWRLRWRWAGLLTPMIEGWAPKALVRWVARATQRAGIDAWVSASRFLGLWVTGVIGAWTLSILALWSLADSLPWAEQTGIWGVSGFVLLAAVLPVSHLQDLSLRRQNALRRQFPYFVELLALIVEAGQTIPSALASAAEKLSVGPLRDEVDRVLMDLRTGRPRHEALQVFANRLQGAEGQQFATAVIAAERQGLSLAPVLRAQAAQRRVERFQRAERAAMQAPVKLLAPLMICIFPCTFVILLFPVGVRLLQSGVL